MHTQYRAYYDFWQNENAVLADGLLSEIVRVLLRASFAILPLLAAPLWGCGSTSADPIGIGSGANELKRSRCAGVRGSPCSERTTAPPTGPALEQWRQDLARQIG